MGDFMPLVEAFLAFALTMLALATAVSAVAGIWTRALRWRALGLRQSLELIYDNEIKRRLCEARRSEPTMDDRAQFIADMTFSMGMQAGVLTSDEKQVRLSELKQIQVGAGGSAGSFKRPVSSIRRLLRRWRSLRFGIDYLPESQFQVRLDASMAGEELTKFYTTQKWTEFKSYVTRYFTEVGVVASESFARRSRVRTVIGGLLLAVMVNVDSFDLINAYMTDEALRLRIIEQQDEIQRPRNQTVSPGVEGASDRATAFRGKIDSAMEEIQSQITALGALDVLDPHARQSVAQLQKSLGEIHSDVQTATDIGAEVEAAIKATREISASLIKTFPIGWDGYPNCRSGTVDLRCTRLQDALSGRTDDKTPLLEVLALVARIDTASFVKWAIGVLLTGFMVGLGAPFWVQTVNRILKLRGEMQASSTNSSAQEGVASGASPATEAAPPARPPVSTGSGGDIARKAADAILNRQPAIG